MLFLIFMVLSLLTYDLFVASPPEHPLNSWTIFYIDSACCVVFLTDFFFRLSQAEDKKWFWKNHWIDFVTSIPVPLTMDDPLDLVEQVDSLDSSIVAIGSRISIVLLYLERS